MIFWKHIVLCFAARRIFKNAGNGVDFLHPEHTRLQGRSGQIRPTGRKEAIAFEKAENFRDRRRHSGPGRCQTVRPPGPTVAGSGLEWRAGDALRRAGARCAAGAGPGPRLPGAGAGPAVGLPEPDRLRGEPHHAAYRTEKRDGVRTAGQLRAGQHHGPALSRWQL